MAHWLLKSEPSCFSINDLKNSPQQTTKWDGVRNFQARNFLRDHMQIGDTAFFYHSIQNPSIVGLTEIVSSAYPDPTQWDPTNEHYDPRSTEEKPLWYLVDVKLLEIFPHPLSLSFLRVQESLVGLELLRKGSRLSVQEVSEAHFNVIMELAKAK